MKLLNKKAIFIVIISIIVIAIGLFFLRKEFNRYLPKDFVHAIDNFPIELFKEDDNNKHPETGLHKYFDNIFVVTLDSRKEYITNKFDSLDTKPHYVKASQSLNKRNLEKIYKELHGENKPLKHVFGAIGAYYSHRQILKECLKSQSKACAIFEDDLIIKLPKEELFNKIEQALQNLPDDWEILYLGRCLDNCELKKTISEHLIKPDWPSCMHAYVVNPKGASILLKHSKYMKKDIDDLAAKLVHTGKLKGYAFDDNLFDQNCNDFVSNIRLAIAHCVNKNNQACLLK